MMRGMPRVFLVVAIAFGCVVMKANAGNESELKFSVLSVPISFYSAADTSNSQGLRKLKPGVRPIERAFYTQYDISGLLAQYGLSFPKGSVAVCHGSMLILRNTEKNIALAKRIFNQSSTNAILPANVIVGFSVYEYSALVPEGLFAFGKSPVSDLQMLTPGKARLLDAISIPVKTGMRLRAVHSIDRNHFVCNTKLEMEMVSFGDGLVSLNTDYVLHAVLPDGGTADIQFTTGLTVWEEYPVVVHASAIQGHAGKYLVVVAEGRTSTLVADLPPPPKTAPQTFLPASSVKSLKPRMIVGCWKIPPGFFTEAFVAGDAGKPRRTINAKEYLKNAGVEFPPGSDAFYDRDNCLLITLNTEVNTDVTDQISEGGIGLGFLGVSGKFCAYECIFPEDGIPDGLEKMTFPELCRAAGSSMKLLDGVSFIAPVEQHSSASHVSDTDPSQSPHTSWETKLEMEPIAGSEVRVITGNVFFQLREHGGDALETEYRGAMKNGSDVPEILRVSPVKDHKGKYIVLVGQSKNVNEGGWVLPEPSPSPAPTPATP